MRLKLLPSSFRNGFFCAFDTADISLMGGARTDGYHRPGCERQRFVIVGVPEYHAALEADPQAKAPGVVGHVEVVVRLTGETPVIEDLVVLHIDKKMRREGFGERAVAAALAAAVGDLSIRDIKASALPFWRKIGAEFESRSRASGQDAIIRRPPAPELWQAGTADEDIENDQSRSMAM